MAYSKDKDYQYEIDQAVSSGDYRTAAQLEQQRNEKIASEGLNYGQTNKYSGWLDDTDYAGILKNQMASGASASDVSETLGKRVNKAAGTEGLSQYAYDDLYSTAMDYILNQGKNNQFSYATAPQYADKYDGKLKELADEILNREPFTYDPEKDETYQQYKDSYTRNGQRAMQDAIGQVSARTGGLASTYATMAGQQAYGNYMSGLADKIPELRQLAYSMYVDEGNNQRANLNMMSGLREFDYNKYLNSLNQYNVDRNFDYGVHRDEISDQKYNDETTYNRQQDKAALMAAAGDYSGYASLWNLTPEQTQKLVDSYAEQKNLSEAQAARDLADWHAQWGDFSRLQDLGVNTSYLSKVQNAELSGLSATNRSSGNTKSDNSRGSASEDYDGLFQAALDSGNPNSFIANHYKEYGFDKSTGLVNDYEAWLSDLEEERSGSFGGSSGSKDLDITNQHGDSWVRVPGYGRLSYQELYNYVESGKIKEEIDKRNGTVTYK